MALIKYDNIMKTSLQPLYEEADKLQNALDSEKFIVSVDRHEGVITVISTSCNYYPRVELVGYELWFQKDGNSNEILGTWYGLKANEMAGAIEDKFREV